MGRYTTRKKEGNLAIYDNTEDITLSAVSEKQRPTRPHSSVGSEIVKLLEAGSGVAAAGGLEGWKGGHEMLVTGYEVRYAR